MQTYLPFIQSLLSDWYLLTLNNALYAGVLATTVWLLTATLYSIRIAAIKRAEVAANKASLKSLNDVQQQLQQSQEESAASALQLEKVQRAVQDETQRALKLEQLIYQRNQQIAGTIQTLATSFDLGERPLLASEDIKADSLWQQHDKVITQLIERLRTELQTKVELQQVCQAETAKLVEKEALFDTLQATLNTHANQLSQLELAFEEQKSLLQQQNNAQQALSDTLRKYQSNVAQPTEPKQEAINVVFQESPDTETALITLAQPEQLSEIAQVNEEPLVASVTWQDEDSQIELVVTTKAAAPMLSDIELHPAYEKAPSVVLNIEHQPINPPQGSLGKIKNLFGKSKQQPIKTEPQWAITTPDEQKVQTSPSNTEQQPKDEVSGKAENTQGKLKGFYSKFRSKAK